MTYDRLEEFKQGAGIDDAGLTEFLAQNASPRFYDNKLKIPYDNKLKIRDYFLDVMLPRLGQGRDGPLVPRFSWKR